MAKKPRQTFERTRLTIIDAAMPLIAQKGITESSLADIAKAVKMSKGTLYYYFPSKEHLVHAIAEHLVEQMNAEFIACLDALPNNASVEELANIFTQIFSPAAKSLTARVRFILLAEAALGHEHLLVLFQNQYKQCRTLLEMGALKSFGADAAQVRSAITWLIPALDGICIQQFLGLPMPSCGDAVKIFGMMMPAPKS